MMAPYNGRKFFSTFGRWAMVAKMLGILPNCFVSPSKVSRTSGAAFSFTSGLTMAMRHLLICEGITWSQESIPNAAQLGTDTGIPTSLTNSPRQRTRIAGKPEVIARIGRTSKGTGEMLRFDLENEPETVRNYRDRVRQREALGEYAMAEKIRQILMQEQDHQIG